MVCSSITYNRMLSNPTLKTAPMQRDKPPLVTNMTTVLVLPTAIGMTEILLLLLLLLLLLQCLANGAQQLR